MPRCAATSAARAALATPTRGRAPSAPALPGVSGGGGDGVGGREESKAALLLQRRTRAHTSARTTATATATAALPRAPVARWPAPSRRVADSRVKRLPAHPPARSCVRHLSIYPGGAFDPLGYAKGDLDDLKEKEIVHARYVLRSRLRLVQNTRGWRSGTPRRGDCLMYARLSALAPSLTPSLCCPASPCSRSLARSRRRPPPA